MLPDLDRLIRLQQLETSAEDARRRIADHPQQVQAFEARLEQARARVADAKQRLADAQTARRADEKDLASVQGRLAKYKDQLLEVKTNREYTAMQNEIATAQGEVDRHEERILERMLEADELTGAVKEAEAELAREEAAVTQEKAALDEEIRRLEAGLESIATARTELVAQISASALATFETVSRGRKGVGVAEAREGHCTVCHVRMRPQVFNEVRQNAAIIQCDSCQRILYFVEKPAGAAVGSEAASQPTTGS